jgi:N-methylhydantoinase B/oxoprolinase/acetone carboxylase alpha subunit
VARPDGEIVDRSGQADFSVEAGDVVDVDTPGGGGFGA